MRIEGHGGKAPISAYPFQGLDIVTEPYHVHLWRNDWFGKARLNSMYGGVWHPAGDFKHPYRTPLGTPVGQLTRQGADYLSSPCGLCGANIQKCRCGQGNRDSAPAIRKTHKGSDQVWI